MKASATQVGYDPAGKLMRTVELPFDLPTCCEFGGKDLDTLYVTSARFTMTPEHLAALEAHGPCPAHRRSFAPVMQMTINFR